MQPELGQLVFGCPWASYEVPDYVEALFFHVLHEAERVYGNTFQRHGRLMDDVAERDVKFAGLTLRAYCWDEENELRRALANFEFDEVKIHWYKHPGRSMSTNQDWEPEQWIAWFNDCIARLRASDEDV